MIWSRREKRRSADGLKRNARNRNAEGRKSWMTLSRGRDVFASLICMVSAPTTGFAVSI